MNGDNNSYGTEILRILVWGLISYIIISYSDLNDPNNTEFETFLSYYIGCACRSGWTIIGIIYKWILPGGVHFYFYWGGIIGVFISVFAFLFRLAICAWYYNLTISFCIPIV